MPTQQNRLLAVSSPLGEDVLLLRSIHVEEELGRLFEFNLELYSEKSDISLSDILGQNLTVRLTLEGQETRFFNGYCSEFTQTGAFGRYSAYRATLRPWLWFLTRTSDCRIFQQKTVPDIVKEVLREHGFDNFEDSLNGSQLGELRAIPRDGFRLRQQADGTGGHLLLFQTREWQACAGTLR